MRAPSERLRPDPPPLLLVDGLFSPAGRMLSGLAILASLLIPPATVHGGPIICLFRRWTDLNCPGCGLTRAFVHVGHLQWQAAFHQHLFGPILFAIIFGCALLALIPAPRRSALARDQIRTLWSAVEPALISAWLVWAGLRLFGLNG